MNHFFAIEISGQARDSLARFADLWRTLAGSRSDIRWLEPSDYHITVKFLGDTTRQDALRLSQAADGIANHYAPFDIRQAPAGAFPSLTTPGVLWAGVAPNAKLKTLAARLDTAAANAGFPAEGRQYWPHITLARLSGRKAIPSPPIEPAFDTTSAQQFVLMETAPAQFNATGARIRYNIVQVFPFSRANTERV